MSNYNNPGNEAAGPVRVHHAGEGPYWKRAHHHWPFWVALGLMLAALAMYILSEDLSMVPHMPFRHSMPGPVAK